MMAWQVYFDGFYYEGLRNARRKAKAPRWFKTLKSFNRCAPFNPPPLVLPRGAGEDEGGGLNFFNGLNVLNGSGCD